MQALDVNKVFSTYFIQFQPRLHSLALTRSQRNRTLSQDIDVTAEFFL